MNTLQRDSPGQQSSRPEGPPQPARGVGRIDRAPRAPYHRSQSDRGISALAVSTASPRQHACRGRRPTRPCASGCLFVAALVFAMVVVGGATRLTDSGLSITEWQPLLGAIPPLNEADWQAAFEKYKAIPEYRSSTPACRSTTFKAIYWWEWTHRFLGRLIGVAFALPFLASWLTGRLRRALRRSCSACWRWAALQGAIGWYMVKSGLVDRIDVSQYRLALHLLTAFAILCAARLARARCRARAAARAPAHGRRAAAALRRIVLFVLVFCRSGLGALVAGLKAGLTYNTWPLMDGRLVPERARRARALVSQLLRECDDGAVRPPRDRLSRRRARACARRRADRASADESASSARPACSPACVLAQMLIGISTLCRRAARARPRPSGRRCDRRRRRDAAPHAMTRAALRGEPLRARRRRARASARCSARPRRRRPCRDCRAAPPARPASASALPNTNSSSMSVPLSASASSRAALRRVGRGTT